MFLRKQSIAHMRSIALVAPRVPFPDGVICHGSCLGGSVISKESRLSLDKETSNEFLSHSSEVRSKLLAPKHGTIRTRPRVLVGSLVSAIDPR